jgi:hypothetical protein
MPATVVQRFVTVHQLKRMYPVNLPRVTWLWFGGARQAAGTAAGRSMAAVSPGGGAQPAATQ